MSVDKVKMYFPSYVCLRVRKPELAQKSGHTSDGNPKVSFWPKGPHRRSHGAKGLKLQLIEGGDARLEFSSKVLGKNYLEGLNRGNLNTAFTNIEKILNHAIEFDINKVLYYSRVVKVENKLDLKCSGQSEKKRFLEVFKFLRYPRRELKQFADTTLFKSKKKSCQIYPKDEEMRERNGQLYRELGGEEIFGSLIRFETRHETSPVLRKIYGKKHGGFVRLADILNEELSKKIVLEELFKLSLPKGVKFPKMKCGFKEFICEQLSWHYLHGHNRIIKDVGAYTVMTKYLNKDWEELNRIYSNTAKDKKKVKSRIDFYRKHFAQHDIFILNELGQNPSDTLDLMRQKFSLEGF